MEEVVDLSIDDPETTKIANAKKLRKKFNELRKYIPFLKYLFELDPKRNSKFKILIDWIKMKNQPNSTLDCWHVISGESKIRRTYEKLKNTMNFPTHIKEIFEGGTSIVISDEEDSNLPSTSSVYKKDLIEDTAKKNQNAKTKQQRSPSSSIKISQTQGVNKTQSKFQKEDESLSTGGKKEQLLSSNSKNNSQKSFSKLSLSFSKRRSSKHCKDLSNEKNDIISNKVDASVFDILSWNDVKKSDDEKRPMLENLPRKEPCSRAYPLPPKKDTPTESKKRKNIKNKHRTKKAVENSTQTKHQSYESLIKQKKELINLLRDDDMIIKASNNADTSNLAKPQEFKLFQRRESTRSERKNSFIEPSIRDSVKSVLNKNPEIIAEVVNDGSGTKIVYDYTNVTKMSNSKTFPITNTVTNQSEYKIPGESKRDCIVTKDVVSKTPETNTIYSSGDAYRKAMKEQQIHLQESIRVQQKVEYILLHKKHKKTYSSSVGKQSQDILANSSIKNKKSPQITDSTKTRSSNSESSSRTSGDHKRTSDQRNHHQLKSQTTDFDETRRKSKQTNSIATFETSNNSSESKQKEDEEVVVMSFSGSCKLTHRIESESSLEDFEPEKINFASAIYSSSVDKVNRNGLDVKSKAEETSEQSISLSRRSKDCESKSSKTKPISVSDSTKITMPIHLKKDEHRKISELKTKKTKHKLVTKNLESANVSPKIDHKTRALNNDSHKDQIVDLESKTQRVESETKKSGKTKKRKHSDKQVLACSSKQKLLKMDNVPDNAAVKKTNDDQKSLEQREIKSKSNSNKNRDITIKDNSYKNQMDSKRKISIESSTNIRTEKKTNNKDKEPILTPKKTINSPVGGSNLQIPTYCLDIDKEEDSRQKGTYNACSIVKDLKRRISIESTKEIHNQPVKKSRTSTELKKNTTPKKTTTDLAERRFNRELNNLSCTFKESLFPQSIRRRRCSSSGLNLSENVCQKLGNLNVHSTPAPIQRRRKTCGSMPNLKLTLQRSTDHNDEYHIKAITNDTSSDETDEFDIDEHRVMNTNISNSNISEKNRISSFKTVESPNKEMPRLIPFDSINLETPTKSLGNNDSKMTFKSTRTCVLCNKSSKDLTSHYVVKHKTESYVSRLSSADIHQLEKEKNAAILVCKNRYRITCVFCKQMVEDHFENFYAHFTYHTGEYNFQCEGCKIKKPYKEDIGSHQLRSRVCRNSEVIKIHNNELETTVIYLHICKLCNFVNLNESNLKKHIRKQHGSLCNELENSKKCILLVKDIHEIEQERQPAGFDGKNCKTNRSASEEAPLYAEQDFKCELPMNIQNILMDEDNVVNGQESFEKSKPNVPKKIHRAKCDITVHSDRDETKGSSLSPEELLEIMHASEETMSETLPKDIQAEANLNNIVLDFRSSEERTSHNNRRLSDELKTSETSFPNMSTVVQSGEIDVENQNDSESLTSIEAYIKNTNEIPSQSPKRRSTHDCNDIVTIDKQRSGTPLTTENEKLNVELNEENQNDSKSLTSIETYIENTNEIPSQSPKRLNARDCNDIVTIDKQRSETPLTTENGKLNVELYEEYQNNSESLTSIEELIKNTIEIIYQRPKIRYIDDRKNSSRKQNCKNFVETNLDKIHASVISNVKSIPNSEFLSSIEANIKSPNKVGFQNSEDISSNNNICKSPERNLKNLYVSQISNEEFNRIVEELVDELPEFEQTLMERDTHTQVASKILLQSPVKPQIEPRSPQYKQSMIYRQYEKFDSNYFGLFKCLRDDCLYSTNSEEEFQMHWSNHNLTKILDCPYCFEKSSCLENLTYHIWHEHRMSNYQCEKCSYRSMVPGKVIIHIRICHKDIKPDALIYKCGYLKISKKSKHKAKSKKTRDSIASLKCPDCSDYFVSSDSIKSHLQKSHPQTFQKFNLLNLNELACIHCKKGSNCKEKMQIHLALQHPDEPNLVFERKLKPKGREDTLEDLMVVDISVDVLETDIMILEESECQNIVNSDENQDTLETEANNVQTVNNCQDPPFPTVMPPDSPAKSCRSPDNYTSNPQSGQISAASFNRSNIPVIEEKNSPMKPNKIKETPQTNEDCSAKLNESDVYSVNFENQQNEQSQTLEDIQNSQEFDPIIEEIPELWVVQSSNEPIPIDNCQIDHLETTSHNFNEAVTKEGERIKCLLELLVEDTGSHNSKLHRCFLCNLSFRHFELWLTHVKNKHKNIEDMECPYCTDRLQLNKSAESHFKKHLRHKYICYYCIASCCSKEKMQEHFATCHDNSNTIEWPIDSFYLVIKEDAIISDYTALLEHFSEEVYLHLIKNIQKNKNNEWTTEMTDSSLDEMEIPQYKPEEQQLFKCFKKLCPFVASSETSLDDHLFQHNLPKTFECSHCMITIEYPSWDSIKCHLLLHRSPRLYVCSVCNFFHYYNEGILTHIENLHNSRDVPVVRLLRDDLNYKISFSIFLPPNKINFTTSKACFCCSAQLRNGREFLYHMKYTHKLSFCPRCQLCGKIILTHLDGEAHYKEDHKMESFKLKYDVLTTFSEYLVLVSRSPLIMGKRVQIGKFSYQQIELNSKDSSFKEEVLVKSELEEEYQKKSISIKCLNTNQLLENRNEKDGNEFESNDISVYSNKQLQTNRDVQHSLGDMMIENTLDPSEPQNSALFTQHQEVLLNTPITTSSQGHVQTSANIQYSVSLTNTVLQYSSQKQPIANEVPLLSQADVPHSTPTTSARCVLTKTTYPDSSLSMQSQIGVRTETLPINCTMPNHERDSLPSQQTQQVVIQKIQLTTGNAILSIPLDVSTAEQSRIGVESQRIPVITTMVAQPNIPPMPAPQPSIPNMQSYLRPVPNAIVHVGQINRPSLDEIAPICGNCNFECIDFIHLQSHYEEAHAIHNESFFFYVERKIGCMYCHFQCNVSSFEQHHLTFHPGRKKLCHNVTDPTRCGICDTQFRCLSLSSASSYSLPPLCACPGGNQRALADCLNWPILNSLQTIGYQYYKYSCDFCKLSFQSAQQFFEHYLNVHGQYIDPQVWRTKIKYYCCMCTSVVSFNISHIVHHIRFSHLEQLRLTLIQKIDFYKRIRIAHPNGFLISLNDLRNTGQFDEEKFKQEISKFEAQYV